MRALFTGRAHHVGDCGRPVVGPLASSRRWLSHAHDLGFSFVLEPKIGLLIFVLELFHPTLGRPTVSSPFIHFAS